MESCFPSLSGFDHRVSAHLFAARTVSMGRRHRWCLRRRATGETSAVSWGGPHTPGHHTLGHERPGAGHHTPGHGRAGRRKCFLSENVTLGCGQGAGCCSVSQWRSKARSPHCCGSLIQEIEFYSGFLVKCLLPLDIFWKVPYSDSCLLKFLCLWAASPWLAARIPRCQSDKPSGLLRSNLKWKWSWFLSVVVILSPPDRVRRPHHQQDGEVSSPLLQGHLLQPGERNLRASTV